MSASMEASRKRPAEEASSDEVAEYICPVCNFKSQDKHCFHYGGVCCYSCRAFFRRAHQGTKTPVFKCKKNNDCEISVKTRRKCQKCRYDLCLKAGMDPELVLSEEQKKIRFRNYLKKKANQEGNNQNQSSSADEANTSDSQEVPRVRGCRGSTANSVYKSSAVHPTPYAYQTHSRYSHLSQQQQSHLVPVNEMHFKVNNTRPAHIFGSGSNEASCLPVLAIMSQVSRQQNYLDQQQKAEYHQPQEVSTEQSRRDTPHRDPDLQYYRSIKAHANIMEPRYRSDYDSDDSIAGMKHWEQPEYLGSPSKRQKMMDPKSCGSRNSASLSTSSSPSSSIAGNDEPQVDFSSTMVAKGYQKHQLIAKEHKAEIIQQNYFLAMAQVETTPKFIDSLQSFHSGKTESLSNEDFLGHLFRLASQFRQFANKQADFQMLTILDQNRLLQRNTSLFLMYILARYISANSGEEQLHWLLDENMPQNLSFLKLQLINFNDLKSKLNFASADNEFETLAKSVADTELAFHCTGLVAYLLLNHNNCGSDSHIDLEEPTKISASFIEALDLLKHAHGQLGMGLQVEPVLKMIKSLDDMRKIFRVQSEVGCDRPNDLPSLPFLDIKLPFTTEEDEWVRKELQWFSDIWEKVPLPTNLMDDVVDHTLHTMGGRSIGPQFLSGVVRLFLGRLRHFALNHPQFKLLTIAAQNRLWSRNCLSCLTLCLLRMEACCTGHDQMRLLMGSPEDSLSWQDHMPHIDPGRLRQIDIASAMMGISDNRDPYLCLKECDVKDFKALGTELGPVFLQDDIRFQLLLSAVLLDGETGFLHSVVSLLQDHFICLLDRQICRNSEIMRNSWKTAQVILEVAKVSAAMVPLIEFKTF